MFRTCTRANQTDLELPGGREKKKKEEKNSRIFLIKHKLIGVKMLNPS